MNFYATSLDQVTEELDTNATTGLAEVDAAQRLEKFGPNALVSKKQKSFLQKIFDQLKDVMVIVLLIAALISFIISFIEGENNYIDSIIILFIVAFNAYLGALQESRAEASLDALKQMSAPSATVIRDSTRQKIAAKDIVIGDIIHLEAGDLVPADARLVESASLQSDEAALTGESIPADKDATAYVQKDAPLGDRLNMVYAGCSITYGRASALVTATGMQTEIGKIAGLLNETDAEATPLQIKLDKLGKAMGVMALAICVIVFLFGLFTGEPPVEMFLTAISLAVAAIPEGLATVVILVLALGVQKMVKEHAIIRSLPAVETLGSTSVICSDKTGTLTQNKMTVKKVAAIDGVLQPLHTDVDGHARQIIMYSALCNDATVLTSADGSTQEIGDPTETALIRAALELGFKQNELAEKYPRLGEIPFDSNRKLMTTVNTIDGKVVAIVKGGFDVLLPRTHATREEKTAAEAANVQMGADALRVLAVGYKTLGEKDVPYTSESLEHNLTFLGLIGLIDPPREESKEAIAIAKKAGIRTVMITGDHVLTASAIARELGILQHDEQAIDGQTLAQMNEATLAAQIENYAVYARVNPEDKIRIVRAWQTKGAVVAMTGDGVNDAPALKAADIGCAMGITGTEVAKDAAAMILTDDNFSTIVKAIKEGRTIYDNIKKTIEFLLGSNIGEVIAVACGILLHWGTTFTAVQLLLINVITDAFPAFALSLEKSDSGTMERKPTPRGESLFAGGLGFRITLQGICIGTLALIAFYLGKYVLTLPIVTDFTGTDLAQMTGRTMAFLTLALSQLVHSYNCRSEQSLFKIGIFSNMALNIAFIGSAAITLIVALVPFLQNIFGLVSLPLMHWFIVLALSLSIFVVVELAKLLRQKK
jgi:Ca2+-transporting ATPase